MTGGAPARAPAAVDDGPIDTNLVAAGLLRDLAAVQTVAAKTWGYKQAASAIMWLDAPLEALVGADGRLGRIPRIGPASQRVLLEVLATGRSETVERAVDDSGRRAEIDRRRGWRRHFLSRARVRAVNADPAIAGPALADYRGDLQMHSTWSDGSQALEDIVAAGRQHGYPYCAITDHSGGLAIANGLSPERFAAQRVEIDRLNRDAAGSFRLLAGVEANIRADGTIDVDVGDRRRFDVVVAAPHAVLRSPADQTARMIAAVEAPAVHVLGHPRGRMFGSRPGVSADWPRVFAAAAASGTAIEIDGDPARQDLDYTLARDAVAAGCLMVLDTDAHAVDQWRYVEIAVAHARLAGVPPERVINLWPLERLLDWAARRSAA
jgi:histidinol phosphatase-like PHP family hydrolase